MEERPRRACLDTNVVIDYLKQAKGTEYLIEKLYGRFDEIALTAITVYELLLGVEYLGGKDRPEIEEIINSSIILPLSEEASREARLRANAAYRLNFQGHIKDAGGQFQCAPGPHHLLSPVCQQRISTQGQGRVREGISVSLRKERYSRGRPPKFENHHRGEPRR